MPDTNIHPLLVKESRRGLRAHPEIPATPGARFACVEEIERFPKVPMEISIWQHETAVAHMRNVLGCPDPECIRVDRHKNVYYACEELVTYETYYPARCLKSFLTDMLPLS